MSPTWTAEPFSLWTDDQRRMFQRMSPEQQRAYVIDNLTEYARRFCGLEETQGERD